jgi:hypothetical protein
MRLRTWTPVLAMMALVGCTLTQSGLRKDSDATQQIIGGRVIAPKRCSLRMILLPMPLNDPVLNDVAWRGADPQAVEEEPRRLWEANGLRIGRITGELPAEVRSAIDQSRAPLKVEPGTIIVPSGDDTLFDLGPKVDQLNLFLSRGDKGPVGKPYRDAKPFLRLIPSHDDAEGVTLRIVPEIHHGPIRQGWSTAPNGTFSGSQLVSKSGQQEDTLRDLAATLTLRPGQVAVLGADPDRSGSLGAFLFTEHEGNSDRRLQKVLFLWAGRLEPEAPVATPENLIPVAPPEMPTRSEP